MKLLYMTACVLMMVPGIEAANAQSFQQKGTKPTKQFMSHQMNQPSPAPEKAPDLSKERVDEIQELYELAKKELEAGQQRPQKLP